MSPLAGGSRRSGVSTSAGFSDLANHVRLLGLRSFHRPMVLSMNNRIKELRLARDWKQSDLAEALSV
ncbi:helix-turn-helix transcriptional regulator [Acetobacter persici]|uniref:helix-turn-helix transcriptional regulator n=1 Tax=Acetobacter persici TaxID=1076596 RepID=UPI001FD5EB78|nr:hypothetical protein [Acetobacter persici]